MANLGVVSRWGRVHKADDGNRLSSNNEAYIAHANQIPYRAPIFDALVITAISTLRRIAARNT
jgi:hypothetical protein